MSDQQALSTPGPALTHVENMSGVSEQVDPIAPNPALGQVTAAEATVCYPFSFQKQTLRGSWTQPLVILKLSFSFLP